MIRLRTSTLETFRRVVETDYAPESELIERIERGQWTDGPTKWQMRAGTAWHNLLADSLVLVPPVSHEDELEEDGFLFSAEDIGAARVHVGCGLTEVTGRRMWNVNGHLVEIEGTADHIRGLVIQDHKTCFSTPEPSHYEQSLQWRFYLLIHYAACFRYNLFHFKEPRARLGTDYIASPDETSCTVVPEQDGYCELKNIISFRMWPYLSMEEDCLNWVSRFIDWASRRRLLHLLEMRKVA